MCDATHKKFRPVRSILLFWDKRSIQMASYLTQNDIAKFVFFSESETLVPNYDYGAKKNPSILS